MGIESLPPFFVTIELITQHCYKLIDLEMYSHRDASFHYVLVCVFLNHGIN
jgi:hypothetical protein